MITISKSQLKSKMLEYFRKIEQTGEEIIVTDNRKPVLKVSPIRPKQTVNDIFSDYQGKIQYFEDILTNTSDEWSDK